METLSNNLVKMKDTVSDLYYGTLNNLKVMEKRNKKNYKKLQRKANEILKSLSVSICFFNSSNKNMYENMFLFESLQLDYNDYETSSIAMLKYLDVNELLKDNNFKIFLKNIILNEIIYQESNNKAHIHTTQYFFSMQHFFGNIRQVFLSYFLLNTRNITLCKIQNITSYIFQGADFYFSLLNIPKNKQEVFQQIITGIKYEKQKNEPFNNTEPRTYNKKEKFDILEKVQNTIKIKYVSGKNGKHSFHSSPISHERQGHYRTLKSGKVIWIGPMVINPDGRVS